MRGKRIVLVIDDSKLDRFIAKSVIQRFDSDLEIVEFCSARTALSYLDSNGDYWPDLIFLDINMPTLNGFDFLREYHDLSVVPQRRCIVMLSSSLDVTEKEKALSSPYVKCFICKPLTYSTVVNVFSQSFC